MTFARYSRILSQAAADLSARAAMSAGGTISRSWRKSLGWLLCATFLTLQFAIVLHSAEHLWHDVEHESAICAVTAANPVGTLAETVAAGDPGWCLVGSHCGNSHSSARVRPVLGYLSRAPPQSIS